MERAVVVSGKMGQAVQSPEAGAPGAHMGAPMEACVPRAQQAEGGAAEDGHRDRAGMRSHWALQVTERMLALPLNKDGKSLECLEQGITQFDLPCTELV